MSLVLDLHVLRSKKTPSNKKREQTRQNVTTGGLHVLVNLSNEEPDE
jgi:hypothetical protein